MGASAASSDACPTSCWPGLVEFTPCRVCGPLPSTGYSPLTGACPALEVSYECPLSSAGGVGLLLLPLPLRLRSWVAGFLENQFRTRASMESETNDLCAGDHWPGWLARQTQCLKQIRISGRAKYDTATGEMGESERAKLERDANYDGKRVEREECL